MRLDFFMICYGPRAPPPLRQQTRCGCFAMVSEMDEAVEANTEGCATSEGGAASSSVDPGAESAVRRHLLMCAAMWSRKGTVDVLISKAEANSALIWLGNTGYLATKYEDSAGATAATARAATTAKRAES
mmetsp:Transcript_7926/g.20429  ORF Transcript_7926/g.20429 Transcript_7926/m.20429 type:complete len:130 (-) Transcript_7926:205-594(-)|eukprot:CAMPEP_0179845868 /NCGR_PEP_ID=MMETSP0982-20121206/5251_1 /TAXON_ID=483367 /ORGANISM="non described non described, Strain CCMP 2436" /LENGTH=129 /DNA_ID=CAMNT_0021730959 /DNA_START=2481 /DNA_END=2870 /DNA_ORIENTATION=-